MSRNNNQDANQGMQIVTDLGSEYGEKIEALRKACLANDIGSMQNVFYSNFDPIDTRKSYITKLLNTSYGGETMLTFAISNNVDAKVMGELLHQYDFNCDHNAFLVGLYSTNSAGHTPLVIAALGKNIKVIETLLAKNKGEIYSKNRGSSTPPHIPSSILLKNALENLKALSLLALAPVATLFAAVKDEDFLAFLGDDAYALQLIIKACCSNVLQDDTYFNKALGPDVYVTQLIMEACRQGYFRLLSNLLINVKQLELQDTLSLLRQLRDMRGYTLLMLATESGSLETIRQLFRIRDTSNVCSSNDDSYRAMILETANIPPYDNHSAMTVACEKGYVDIVNFYFARLKYVEKPPLMDVILPSIKSGSVAIVTTVLDAYEIKQPTKYDLKRIQAAQSIEAANRNLPSIAHTVSAEERREASVASSTESSANAERREELASKQLTSLPTSGANNLIPFISHAISRFEVAEIAPTVLMALFVRSADNGACLKILHNLSEEKRTALFLRACAEGNAELTKLLLTVISNPALNTQFQTLTTQDTEDCTPLMLACMSGNLKTVTLLVDACKSDERTLQAIVKAKNNKNQEVLRSAISCGNSDIVTAVLTLFVDDSDFLSVGAVVLALIREHAQQPLSINVLEALLIGCVNKYITPEFFIFNQEDQFKLLKLFCEKKTDFWYVLSRVPVVWLVDSLQQKAHTMAKILSVKFSNEVCNLNLAATEGEDKVIKTPLSLAIQNQYIDLVEVMLNIHKEHADDPTQVLATIEYDLRLELLITLCNRGEKNANYHLLNLLLADPNFMARLCGDRDNLELLLACKSGCIDLVSAVLERCEDSLSRCHMILNNKDRGNMTCLMIVCQRGYMEIVKLLMETLEVTAHSMALNATAVWGETPLMMAQKNGHSAIVSYLSKLGEVDKSLSQPAVVNSTPVASSSTLVQQSLFGKEWLQLLIGSGPLPIVADAAINQAESSSVDLLEFTPLPADADDITAESATEPSAYDNQNTTESIQPTTNFFDLIVGLREALVEYKKQKPISILGLFSKTKEKEEAVEALTTALNALEQKHDHTVDPKHYPILQDGRLGSLIKRAIAQYNETSSKKVTLLQILSGELSKNNQQFLHSF